MLPKRADAAARWYREENGPLGIAVADAGVVGGVVVGSNLDADSGVGVSVDDMDSGVVVVVVVDPNEKEAGANRIIDDASGFASCWWCCCCCCCCWWWR